MAQISRRSFLAGSTAAATMGTTRVDAAQRNLVFITIDDLLSVVHSRNRYGVTIETPSLDRLMARGLTFRNAFCTAPLCNPSRTSFLSGRNPFKTRVHENETSSWDRIDIWSTFPGRLRTNGYRCFLYGKVSHGGAAIWEESGICAEASHHRLEDGEQDDVINTDAAIRRIGQLGSDHPFLLMVGLRAPHEPYNAPPSFYADYPIESVEPINWSGDPPPDPQIAQAQRAYFAHLESAGEVDDYIQGYLASVAVADAQLGRLLSALDDSGLRPAIILTSDHGYMLGEHDAIAKDALWSEACRAPLIVHGGPRGEFYNDAVSLLDIAPTFMRWAGLSVPPNWDGETLTPLIADPTIRRRGGALTCVVNDLGESVSLGCRRFRLTRYFDGSLELYDLRIDPLSRDNLADDPDYAAVRDRMMARLDAKLAAWKA